MDLSEPYQPCRDDDCYYTPARVRWWLDRYPALRAASEYGCSLGDLSGDGHALGTVLYAPPRRDGVDPNIDPRYYRMPSRTYLVHDLASLALCVKADLDRAVSRALDDRERRVVCLRWFEEWTVREIGERHRLSFQRIAKICDRAVDKIARNLGYTQ